jgi:hypothetical protein
MEVYWWKCQVVGKGATQVFRKGEVVFAKKREQFIVLFDGNNKKDDLPRRSIRDLKILSRLDKNESAIVDRLFAGSKSKLGEA